MLSKSRFAQQHIPPPATVDGAGYGAACYALAGKIDQAEKVIDRFPAISARRRLGMYSRLDTRWPMRGTISQRDRSCVS